MTKQRYLFSLIGPGRVGSSISMALTDKGWACKSVVLKSSSEAQTRKLKSLFPEAKIIHQSPLMQDDFKVLLIAVQDHELQKVVTQISGIEHIDWRSKIVLHVSGVKAVEVLSPLKRLGAAIGALHPIAAFANEYQPNAALEIYYDFLGDKDASQTARQITRLLKSKLIHLRSEKQRVLLHIASAMASNSTVIAVRKAEELISNFVDSADARGLMEGLLASTIKNLSVNRGMESLTGPLTRGDIGVIAKHIRVLENDKTLLQFYKSWSLLGVELLLKDKDLVERSSRSKRTTLKEIKRLLEKK